MELTDRKKRVLRAIVETYINTAEPVGSKAIAQLAGLDVSAATIRNEMADLTEMGLLEQPHTSAGRVPSAAGYRLYVNELMGQHQLTLQETERINRALNLKMEELDRVIDQAGKVLSQISDYPVFSIAAGPHPAMHSAVAGPSTRKGIAPSLTSIPAFPSSRERLTNCPLSTSVGCGRTPALTAAGRWWICWCWMVGMNG